MNQRTANIFNKYNAELSGISGAIVFLIVFGLNYLKTNNINWLMHGDPATHYIGWEFFRRTPWQIPFGANPLYGDSLSSSIVFSDSIPLMALSCKILDFFLAKTFQYTGIWILICFVLQGYFSNKLLGLFNIKSSLKFICTLYFLISPILLWRLHGHFALSAHWVILASLYLYFRKSNNQIIWFLLIWTCALIHAYLLFMVLAVWVANDVMRLLTKQCKLKEATANIAIGIMSTIMILWLTGYFILGDNVSMGGFGNYRFNLLSMFNPSYNDGVSNQLLKIGRWGQGDYEGNSYIGLGIEIIILLIILNTKTIIFKKIFNNKTWPLIFVFIILFILAISNHIAIGNYEFLHYSLPNWFDKFTGIIRCSGRLMWPIYYSIITFALVSVCKKFSLRIRYLILISMFFLQIYDLKNELNSFRKNYEIKDDIILKNNMWDYFSKYYTKIFYIFPCNAPDGWMQLCHYAAINNKSINIGYFARIDSRKQRLETKKMIDNIYSGNIDSSALYIFNDSKIWEYAQQIGSVNNYYGVLDHYKIMAPNLKIINPDLKNDKHESNPDNPFFIEDYSSKNNFFFRKNGNGQKYLAYGWYDTEEWGVWSQEESILCLAKPLSCMNPLKLKVTSMALCGKKNQQTLIDVIVNGKKVDELKYNCFSTQTNIIQLPSEIFDNDKNIINVKFISRNPLSPKQVGLNNDPRILGIGLISIHID